VLQRERVHVHANFFTELGGHSLLATQVASRLRERFDVELPLRSFFESPTIAQLASRLEELLVADISAMSDDEVNALLEPSALPGGPHVD
jgi:acyl carrier protein